MEEIWKEIEGYEGTYWISNLGRIWSTNINNFSKTFITTVGYEYFSLCKKGDVKKSGVHRLVAKHFVDGYQENLEVNHKDLNKLNNVYTNLEWVTRSQNQKHQFKMRGKEYVPTYCQDCGKEICKNSKYCYECVGFHRRSKNAPTEQELLISLINCDSIKEVGRVYNCSDNRIRRYCKRYNLPYKRNKIIDLKKKYGTYTPSKNSLKKSKEERYKHYEVNGEKYTASGWSLKLGLEQKRIGRYANNHSEKQVIEYIKYWLDK